MTKHAPIACSLAPAELRARTSEIADLNRRALRRHAQHGSSLELTYEPSAADEVRELVRREQRCCAFLDFELGLETDAVRLRVTAPQSAGAGTSALLSPFLEGVDAPRKMPGVGLVTGTSAAAAVACAVCCVVPVAFPAITLTALGAVVAAFANVYQWALVTAFVLVLGGWIWVAVQRARTYRRPARGTVRGMVLATLLFAVAASWPLFEGYVVRAIRR